MCVGTYRWVIVHHSSVPQILKEKKKARNVSAFEPGLNVKWGMGKWPVVGNNNHSVIFFVGEKALMFLVSCSNLHTMIVIQAFKQWVLFPKPSQTSS